jgi:hypothetical protein
MVLVGYPGNLLPRAELKFEDEVRSRLHFLALSAPGLR